MMEFYTLRFGPSKRATAYTVIEIPDGWGSQASDFYILQDAGAFKDPTRIHELYHEIGHSWNMKEKPEVRRTRWFDEAFASYFEAIALRELSGAEGLRRSHGEIPRALPERGEEGFAQCDDSHRRVRKRGTRRQFLYQRCVVAVRLNQIVGDEAFNQIIRTSMADFMERPAGFSDFQAVAESVSRRDLSRFFQGMDIRCRIL